MNHLELFRNYLLSKKNMRSKATVKNYQADIKKFIKWYELQYKSAFNAKKITWETIAFYLQFLKTKQSFSESSINRYSASLRAFFSLLNDKKIINFNPFNEVVKADALQQDPCLLDQFRLHLLSTNRSKITVKNYLSDIKLFLKWLYSASSDAGEHSKTELLSMIDLMTIEEYKNRLGHELKMSPLSINRKLSSIRSYLNWLKAKNIEIKIRSKKINTIDKSYSDNTEIPFSQQIKAINTKKILEKSNQFKYKEEPIKIEKESILTSIADKIITLPLVIAIEKIQFLFWTINGKKVFKKEKIAVIKSANIGVIKTSHILKGNDVRGIPKSFYAPLKISTKNLTLFQKTLYHIKHTRPKWYKKYHSYHLSTQLHLGALIIVTTLFGYLIYNSIMPGDSRQRAVFANPALTPPKTILFKGKLTDSTNNSITSETPLRLSLYNDRFASGSAMLWQEVQSIQPDHEGNFTVMLGMKNQITADIINNNPGLYLGISIKADPELMPRHQIATTEYSENAQRLNGLSSITQTGSGTKNVILALDSSGNLTIGGKANPIFQSIGGQFTLSGNTILLTTNLGSDTNIEIAPDGNGLIDLQKPLTNTTFRGNNISYDGAVEIGDILAIIATSSGQSALTIDQNSSGPIISASNSGIAKFTLENNGSAVFAGSLTVNGESLNSFSTTFNLLGDNINNLTIGNKATSISIGYSTGSTRVNNTLIAGNGIMIPPEKLLIASGNVASDLIPSAKGRFDLGSSNKPWNNAYIDNLYTSPQATISGFWQKKQGVIAPLHVGDDLIIGGISTKSALFHIFGSGNLAGTASTSGQLTFSGNSQINLLNSSGLGFYNSPAGDSGINSASPALLISSNGNIGMGTTTPKARLDVIGNSSNQPIASFSGATSDTGVIIDNRGSGDILKAGSSGTTHFVIKQNGNIGIGDNDPTNTLKVVGSLCVNNSSAPCSQNTPGTIYAVNTSLQNADVAENYISDSKLEQGSIVTTAGKNNYMAVKQSTDPYQSSVLGVVSTNPGITLNSNAEPTIDYPFVIPLALSGRVPVRISTINGEIKAGDLITSSSIPGVGMKSTNAGVNIGKALEDYSNPDPYDIGSIVIFVNLSYYDHSIGYEKKYNPKYNYEQSSSKISIQNEIYDAFHIGFLQAKKTLTTGMKNSIENISTGSHVLNQLAISNIEKTISKDTASNHSDEISNAENPNNNSSAIISPLSADLAPPPNQPELKDKIASASPSLGHQDTPASGSSGTDLHSLISSDISSPSAFLLGSQSASISSDLISASASSIDKTATASASSMPYELEILDPARINDPLISESVYNDDFDNDALIEILKKSYDINLNFITSSSFSSTSATLSPSIDTSIPKFNHGLTSYERSFMSDLTIAGQLNVNGSLIISDNSINNIGSPLRLQDLRQGDLSIMGELVNIDTFGNLSVAGNAFFDKDLSVKGRLTASFLAPVPDSDLIIQLQDGHSSSHEQKLAINNASGSGILTVNPQGDLKASGSGTFTRIAAGAFNIVRGAEADTSLTKTIASSSAGTATITSHETERTIISPFITEESLIYLTTASDSKGLTPYIARQNQDSFTIAIPYPIDKSIKVNWWIIN